MRQADKHDALPNEVLRCVGEALVGAEGLSTWFVPTQADLHHFRLVARPFALAVNGALVNSGYPSTRSALARSFTRYGTRLSRPVRGAIVVFPRGTNPLYGHVGIVERVNGDGTIQQAEFVDVVMTRWKPSVTSGHAAAAKARQDTSSKTLIANDGGKMATAMAKYRGVPELKFALGLLILKIVGGLKSGSHGVMRMWQEFRSKCSASSDGVVLAEFEHGLKMYGIDVSKDLALKMLQKTDNNGSGNIQIFGFIDNLMGRWSDD